MGKKLVFKGEKAKSKKKKTKHSVPVGDDQLANVGDSITQQTPVPTSQYQSAASHFQTSSSSQNPSNATSSQPIIRRGEGKITSSGTVLMGFETKFNSSINVGDAIIVEIPSDDGSSSREEMRVIAMRLSDTSASISSSFSKDLKHPTPFQFIKKPKNVQKERDEKEKKERMTKEEIERSAFGTYKSGDGKSKELVYRERTEHGSYRIRREEVDGDSTRSDLLNMRTKKKSDKFC